MALVSCLDPMTLLMRVALSLVAILCSPLRDIEQDLVLETLANTRGNRTASARLLGVSVRTLRNKIAEYAARGVDVPRHETRGDALNRDGIRGTAAGDSIGRLDAAIGAPALTA